MPKVSHAPRRPGIYHIIQVGTDREYIGSAKDISRRWDVHISDLNNPDERHHSAFLQRCWDKYGREAFHFEVIEFCPINQLLIREQHYLDTRHPAFNSSPTAGSCLGVKRSPEEIESMRQRALGRKWTIEQRANYHPSEKMLASLHARKGKPISEVQRAALLKPTPGRLAHLHRLMEMQIGRPASQHRKDAISKSNRGVYERKKSLGLPLLSEKQITANVARRGKPSGQTLTDEQQVNLQSGFALIQQHQHEREEALLTKLREMGWGEVIPCGPSQAAHFLAELWREHPSTLRYQLNKFRDQGLIQFSGKIAKGKKPSITINEPVKSYIPFIRPTNLAQGTLFEES